MFYLACMIVQILSPSFVGSMLLDNSEKLTHAIYSSDWTECSDRWKSAYLIFTERTLKAMTIFAGGLFLLSIPTFVSVIIIVCLHHKCCGNLYANHCF